MTVKLFITIMLSALMLSACQTASKATSKVESESSPSADIMTAEQKVIAPDKLDSDGDSVYDESDVCPDTDMNLIVDDKGCPISFTFHMGEENINKSRVFYLENSSEISVIDAKKLDSIIEVLQEYPDTALLIEGHIGKSEYVKGSDSLARHRAERLKNHMIINYNIDANRIGTYSCRYYLPIASNDDLETRYMNQRSEIELGTKIHDGSSSCERFNY